MMPPTRLPTGSLDPFPQAGQLNLAASVVVVAALAGGLLFAARGVSGLFRRLARASLTEEVSTMHRDLLSRLDCTKTLAGITPTKDCRPDRQLTLLDARGSALAGKAVTKNNGLHASAPLLGRWHVRATCDGKARALIVLVAKKGRFFGDFATDPETGRHLDFQGRLNPWFGPADRLCGPELGGTAKPQLPEGGPA